MAIWIRQRGNFWINVRGQVLHLQNKFQKKGGKSSFAFVLVLKRRRNEEWSESRNQCVCVCNYCCILFHSQWSTPSPLLKPQRSCSLLLSPKKSGANAVYSIKKPKTQVCRRVRDLTALTTVST